MQKKYTVEERFHKDRDCKNILSFTKQREIFHTTIIIKSTIGFSISMKFAYQTKTKQYNDQSHLEFCSKQNLRRQPIKNSI